MYRLQPLLPEFEIDLPTSMYKLQNIMKTTVIDFPSEIGVNGHFTAKLSTKTANTTTKNGDCALDLDILGANIQQILKSANDYNEICTRQCRAFEQLNELKVQMEEMRASLKLTSLGSTVSIGGSNKSGVSKEPLPDIVINGHPNFVPYALLALKNAWKDDFDIEVKVFTHSTMADVGQEAREFEEKLQNTAENVANVKSKPKINVTLIWKNCEHTEMISSPTIYVPIYGEVNIIRYLGRIGPPAYRYEDSPLCNEIDLVLDICYQLLRCNTPKGIADLIRALNERLGEQQYFGGDSMSVADVGVHSSLKRLPKIKDKDLTSKLLAWRKRAELVTRI